MGDKVKEKIRDQVRRSVADQVADQTTYKIGNQVLRETYHVWNQVRAKVVSQALGDTRNER